MEIGLYDETNSNVIFINKLKKITVTFFLYFSVGNGLKPTNDKIKSRPLSKDSAISSYNIKQVNEAKLIHQLIFSY